MEKNRLGLITPKEFEQMTGYKTGSQSNMRCQGRLPYVKIGRKVFYRIESIRKMFEEHEINKQK